MFLIPSSWYKVKTLKKKGQGVFALHDIAAGTVIGDYLGKLIPFDGADERKDGLYDMAGGSKYDIFGRSQKKIKEWNYSTIPARTTVICIPVAVTCSISRSGKYSKAKSLR